MSSVEWTISSKEYSCLSMSVVISVYKYFTFKFLPYRLHKPSASIFDCLNRFDEMRECPPSTDVKTVNLRLIWWTVLLPDGLLNIFQVSVVSLGRFVIYLRRFRFIKRSNLYSSVHLVNSIAIKWSIE